MPRSPALLRLAPGSAVGSSAVLPMIRMGCDVAVTVVCDPDSRGPEMTSPSAFRLAGLQTLLPA